VFVRAAVNAPWAPSSERLLRELRHELALPEACWNRCVRYAAELYNLTATLESGDGTQLVMVVIICLGACVEVVRVH